MKPNLILHIGSPKTGTSHIQKKLIKNQKILHLNDYHYLDGLRWHDGAHHRLGFSIRGVRYGNDTFSFQESLKIIDDEIKKIPYKNIIVSSEILFYNVSKNVVEFNDFLERFNRVDVISYTRNPVDYLESLYKQMVRDPSDRLKMIPSLFVDKKIKSVDYLDVLKSYSDLEKVTNLISLNYDNEKHNLFHSFINLLDIEKVDGMQVRIDEVNNTTLDGVGLKLKLHFNKIFDDFKDNKSVLEAINDFTKKHENTKLKLNVFNKEDLNKIEKESGFFSEEYTPQAFRKISHFKIEKFLLFLKDNYFNLLLKLPVYNINVIKEFTPKQSAAFLCHVLNKKSLSISLPSDVNKETICRANLVLWQANILHFSTINNDKNWYLIQIAGVVSGYIEEGKLIVFNKKGAVETIYKKYLNNEFNFDLNNNNEEVDGLDFTHIRPYHFLFDKLVSYYYLNSELDDVKEYCYKGDSCFFDFFDGFTLKVKGKDKNLCLLSPSVVSDDCTSEYAEKMLIDLNKTYAPKKIKDQKFRLWIGVTSQKRTWKEQINGYINILNNLLFDFSEIEVFIDGWTNSLSEKFTCEGDFFVFNEIKSYFCNNENIVIKSMINHTYPEKIKVCGAVDRFIANDGSGSIVPRLICNKKGVLIGNNKFFTFKHSEIYDGLKTLDNNEVKVVESGPAQSSDYSIDWHIILKKLKSTL